MKRIGITLISALAVLLIVCIAVYCTADRDADWYQNYVHRYGRILAGIGEEPSSLERWALYRGGIDTISEDADKTIFYLKTAPLEGHCALVYAPGGEYLPSCLDFYDNWMQTQSQSAYLRWEGGMDGKAFVDLYILGEGFYLEDAYLPT